MERVHKWLGTLIASVIFVTLLTGMALAQRSIVYYGGPQHGQEILDLVKGYAQSFEATTGIKVQIEVAASSGEYADRLMTMLIGGSAPDVTHLEHNQAAMFYAQDLLTDLAPFLAADGLDLRELYLPPVVEALEWGEGSIYQLPLSAQAFNMFYNVDHFQQSGLADPHSLAAQGEWDWDAFTDVATRLTQRDAAGEITRAGAQLPINHNRFETVVWQAGGSLYDQAFFPTRAQFNTPEVRRSLEWYSSLWTVHNVAGGNFRQGTAAISFAQGPFEIGRLRAADVSFDWDIAPVLRGPVQEAVFMSMNNLQVPKDARDKEAAWEFLKFIAFNQENVEQFIEQTTRPPALWSMFPSYLDVIGPHPLHAGIFLESLLLARSGIVSGQLNQINSAVNAVLQQVMRGEKSILNSLIEIDERVNAILER